MLGHRRFSDNGMAKHQPYFNRRVAWVGNHKRYWPKDTSPRTFNFAMVHLNRIFWPILHPED